MSETLTNTVAIKAEVDEFAAQLSLRRQAKLEESLFAEARLRQGVYGQRYDNGQRHDGRELKKLAYPERPSKGPNTVWDAPGMMRLKIPYGALTPTQLSRIADLADAYADGILHITTRQDIQLHFVHIDDTPDLMRRLADVGLTTREACGNSVRNVTSCPRAGVCSDELFDVTPYARGLADFLLGHDDVQDFGRKFKIAFSGCKQNSCALTNIHDLGFNAQLRRGEDGELEQGFEVVVGGGLGTVPHAAKTLAEFVPLHDILPLTHAVCRVFAQHGERKNRARARIKFLVAKLGIDRFRELVAEQRRKLRDAKTVYPSFKLEAGRARELFNLARQVTLEQPKTQLGPPARANVEPTNASWLRHNVAAQRQPGFYTVTIAAPLGDLTVSQAREVARLARTLCAVDEPTPALRLSIHQNIIFRWVPSDKLGELHRGLLAIDLADPSAHTIADITSCPGTDTCKLGIASSRGLAAELRRRLRETLDHQDPRVATLRIKVSGCFNSCGQHHVADIGFFGVSRKHAGVAVPHFQVVLGGQLSQNGAAYGLAVGAIPAKHIPDTVTLLTERFASEAEPDELFRQFVQRSGKATIKKWLAPLAKIPDYAQDSACYRDWGDIREFGVADMGVGECAGQVVSATSLGLARSEAVAFDAQLALDAGSTENASTLAFSAMCEAARTLLLALDVTVPKQDEAAIVDAFETHLHRSRLFHDPFAGAKFAHYFLQKKPKTDDPETARQRVEEAQLFIEAAHGCYARMG
jgi:sulfite reductase (ferredoxin)